MLDSELEPKDVEIDEEVAEEDEADALHDYEVVTFPADYTLSVLVDKWRRDQIVIPDFQRGFVWKQNQASRLIESFLLGLPVPAIFLYTDRANRNIQLVVDGQQRLRTIAYFFEGYFGEPNARGRRVVFRLTGLNPKSPFANKTYEDLRLQNPAALNKLNDSVLRAFVIQQLDPNDDTSIYHIFERLNTGGTLLYPQEIRNAIAHGAFNNMLHRLNTNPEWRELLGTATPDKRQRDIELILRVMALSESLETYQKPMKDFLNNFMQRNRNLGGSDLNSLQARFSRAIDMARLLSPRPFRRGAGLNAAIFDAVMTVLMTTPETQIPRTELSARYTALMADEDFEASVSRSTTDDEVVATRVRLARQHLVG